jgi:hypothetical protein
VAEEKRQIGGRVRGASTDAKRAPKGEHTRDAKGEGERRRARRGGFGQGARRPAQGSKKRDRHGEVGPDEAEPISQQPKVTLMAAAEMIIRGFTN